MVHNLLTNANTVTASPFVNVGRVATLVVVVELSSDYVPGNPNGGDLIFEEAEDGTDTGTLPTVPGYNGADPASAGQTVFISHLPKQYWLSLRVRLAIAPSAGSLSVRLYVPDGD